MINVTTELELRNAIISLESEIVVENFINITSPLNINYETKISGGEEVSLFWSNPTASNNNMIIIGTNGNLTIESLILDAEGRDGTLVYVNGGIFTMAENTILRNINSRAANNAVRIGNSGNSIGGTFNMNYGLITGINSSDAVFNYSGSIFMNNDATIMGNNSAGVSMARSQLTGNRPKLTMSGTSTIANNESSQGASAGISLGADIIMGVNPGDAPSVKNNRSSQLFGGWYLSSASTLIMRYNSEISGNSAAAPIGGLGLAYGTVLTMYDNASISNNYSDSYCGGVALAASTAIMNGNAKISGNTTPGNGGGIYLQSGSTLEIKDNATITNNQGQYGGGIFISSTETSNSTVTVGTNNSVPRIISNTATINGGGIFITPFSILNLTGQTLINNNSAVLGKGVYKLGALNLSESLKILDGLYFDSTEINPALVTEEIIKITMAETIEVDYKKEIYNFYQNIVNPFEGTPVYTSNVPVIVDALNADAVIQLESSNYVSPSNVPLVIADKGMDYQRLSETDRQAWVIPNDFSIGHQIILNEESDQVWIVLIEYTIAYENLFDATHTNPDTYNISELPITLTPPTNRLEFRFIGWRNEQGEIISAIPAGTTGNLTLTAIWEEIAYTITYLNLQGCTHTNPAIYTASILPITLTEPTRRQGYKFNGWRNGQGEIISAIPAETTGNLTLTAIWEEIAYTITYLNLQGSTHTNPATYTVSILPITLTPPTNRLEFRFIGWRNEQGEIISAIPAGTTGNLTLTAIWEEIAYTITYLNLQGSTHTNPATYTASILPITLTEPTRRQGYKFNGWRNEQGEIISAIPAGTTGNITLTAIWETLYLYFNGNACCVCNLPKTIQVTKDKIKIPCSIPYIRGYQFIGWNTSKSGYGKFYFPGDSIIITDKSIILTAQWREIC